MNGNNMPEAVVLAAGKATRAGDFKLGWIVGEEPVLISCIRNLLPFCSRVTVVTGYRPDRIQQLVSNLDGVTTAHNPDFEQGMFTSVRTGLESTTAARILVTPGDIPLVAPDVIRKLLDSDADVAIPTYLGRKGHPVLLSDIVRRAALQAEPDSTLKQVLDRFHPLFVPVACEGILLDIDTIADYNDLREFHEQHNP